MSDLRKYLRKSTMPSVLPFGNLYMANALLLFELVVVFAPKCNWHGRRNRAWHATSNSPGGSARVRPTHHEKTPGEVVNESPPPSFRCCSRCCGFSLGPGGIRRHAAAVGHAGSGQLQHEPSGLSLRRRRRRSHRPVRPWARAVQRIARAPTHGGSPWGNVSRRRRETRATRPVRRRRRARSIHSPGSAAMR